LRYGKLKTREEKIEAFKADLEKYRVGFKNLANSKISEEVAAKNNVYQFHWSHRLPLIHEPLWIKIGIVPSDPSNGLDMPGPHHSAVTFAGYDEEFNAGVSAIDFDEIYKEYGEEDWQEVARRKVFGIRDALEAKFGLTEADFERWKPGKPFPEEKKTSRMEVYEKKQWSWYVNAKKQAKGLPEPKPKSSLSSSSSSSSSWVSSASSASASSSSSSSLSSSPAPIHQGAGGPPPGPVLNLLGFSTITEEEHAAALAESFELLRQRSSSSSSSSSSASTSYGPQKRGRLSAAQKKNEKAATGSQKLDHLFKKPGK
jgi:hypothetical protein